MATSKMQRKFSQTLSYHFCKYTILENSRPAWCLGDKGERLELDFLISELNVAVEIQGQQHYQFTPMFHATYADFLSQLERDLAKQARCDEMGILLLEVGDHISSDDAIQFIREVARQYEALTNPKIDNYDPVLSQRTLFSIRKQCRRIISQHKNYTYIQYMNELNGVQCRLRSMMEKYGQKVFTCLDEDVIADIFFWVQKCRTRAEHTKKNTKQQKKKE